MPQSVKGHFTQDDIGTELYPGARASASARGGGRRGQERVTVHTRMGTACCRITMALWRTLCHSCANAALAPWRLCRVLTVTLVICKQPCLRSSGSALTR